MIDALRTFRLVAQTASFTDAARLAGLTRPAVSQQISQLERQLGVQLVARTTRRVALTPAGEALLIHAGRVMAAVADLEQTMVAFRHDIGTTLRVGASSLPGECLVPAALSAFRNACPTVEARVRVGDTDAVLGWVRDGQVDLGLIGRQVTDPALVVEPLLEDRILLVFPPGRPGPADLAPAELANVALVLREAGSATRATVLATLAGFGVELRHLRVVAELGSPEAVKAAVRSGIGAGFVSAACLAPGELPVSRISGIDMRRPVCACWRKDRPLLSAAKILLRVLAEYHLDDTIQGDKSDEILRRS